MIEERPLIMIDTNCKYDSEISSFMKKWQTMTLEDDDEVGFNENLKINLVLDDQPLTKCSDFGCTKDSIYLCTDKGEMFSKLLSSSLYIRV